MKGSGLKVGSIVQPDIDNHLACVIGQLSDEGVGCLHSTPDDPVVRMGMSYKYEEISPIALSPEWLLRMGFIQEPHGHRKFVLENDSFLFELSGNSDQISIYATGSGQIDVTIKYVHEFQNLYCALTGEDLIIR